MFFNVVMLALHTLFPLGHHLILNASPFSPKAKLLAFAASRGAAIVSVGSRSRTLMTDSDQVFRRGTKWVKEELQFGNDPDHRLEAGPPLEEEPGSRTSLMLSP